LNQAVHREIAHFVGWKSRETGKGPETGPECQDPKRDG
jgi:hypothetical protein